MLRKSIRLTFTFYLPTQNIFNVVLITLYNPRPSNLNLLVLMGMFSHVP